jgi:hypothetical protein
VVQYLFLDTDLRVRLDQVQRDAIEFIRSMSGPEILAKSVDEWLSTIMKKFALHVPEIDTSAIERTSEPALVPVHRVPNPSYRDYDYGDSSVSGTAHTFHIPYKGDQTFFYLKPSQYMQNTPQGSVKENEILFYQAGAWLTTDEINRNVEQAAKAIQESLARLRNEVTRFEQDLPGVVRVHLDERRRLAEADASTTAGIKYPLKPRQNAPNTYSVPSIRPRVAPAAPIPSAPAADPTLLEEHYNNILRIIENMTLVMERSPSAFAKMEEEHIRFHYLVQLNGQYDGAAVGEAFNFEGKTDILVRHQNHNLFIAECKFWSGPKGLKDTVDQILRYITWRDTKTALIIFVDRKNFTAIVEEALKAMNEHPQVLGKGKKESETRYRYAIKLPTDPDRQITLTLMLFNVPKSGA